MSELSSQDLKYVSELIFMIYYCDLITGPFPNNDECHNRSFRYVRVSLDQQSDLIEPVITFPTCNCDAMTTNVNEVSFGLTSDISLV